MKNIGGVSGPSSKAAPVADQSEQQPEASRCVAGLRRKLRVYLQFHECVARIVIGQSKRGTPRHVITPPRQSITQKTVTRLPVAPNISSNAA